VPDRGIFHELLPHLFLLHLIEGLGKLPLIIVRKHAVGHGIKNVIFLGYVRFGTAGICRQIVLYRSHRSLFPGYCLWQSPGHGGNILPVLLVFLKHDEYRPAVGRHPLLLHSYKEDIFFFCMVTAVCEIAQKINNLVHLFTVNLTGPADFLHFALRGADDKQNCLMFLLQ
jgi:hypothetical protein